MFLSKTKAAVVCAALLMLTQLPLHADPTTQVWHNDSNYEWQIRARWMPSAEGLRNKGNVSVTRMKVKGGSLIPDGSPTESFGETAGNNTIKWPANTSITVKFEIPSDRKFNNDILLLGPEGDYGQYTACTTYYGFEMDSDNQTFPVDAYKRDGDNYWINIDKTYDPPTKRGDGDQMSLRLHMFSDQGLMDDTQARAAVIASAKGAKGSVYLPKPVQGDFVLLGLDVKNDPPQAEVSKRFRTLAAKYLLSAKYDDNFKNMQIAYEKIKEYYFANNHK